MDYDCNMVFLILVDDKVFVLLGENYGSIFFEIIKEFDWYLVVEMWLFLGW